MSIKRRLRKLTLEALEDKRLLSVTTFDLENDIGHGSTPGSFHEVDGEVRFTSSNRLWASNGLNERPTTVFDFYPDRGPQLPNGYNPTGEIVILSANNHRYAVDYHNIWKEEGDSYISLVETERTIQSRIILPDGTLIYQLSASTGVGNLHAVGPDGEDRVFHSLPDEGSRYRWITKLGDQIVFLVSHSNEDDVTFSVHLSDGTSDGTTTLIQQTPGDRPWGNGVVAGDKVWFSVDDEELWTTDGTPSGTYSPYTAQVRLVDFVPAPQSEDSVLFFELHELRSSDGATGQTQLIVDLERELPFGATSMGEYVYFFTRDLAIGLQDNPTTMWRTDGTAENTIKLADQLPFWETNDYWRSDNVVNYQGDIFFSATSESHGAELWKLDTETNSVEQVADLVPGPVGSEPLGLFATARGIYFQHSAESSGTELGIYTADGTSWHNENNPYDVNQDSEVSPIDALQVINELNLPSAIDATSGRLLASARPLSSLDVNDDVSITPIDALLVINKLNSLTSDQTPAASALASTNTVADLPRSIDFVFAMNSTDDEEE